MSALSLKQTKKKSVFLFDSVFTRPILKALICLLIQEFTFPLYQMLDMRCIFYHICSLL